MRVVDVVTVIGLVLVVVRAEYLELFGDPYRSAADVVAPNPTFRSMAFQASVSVSYQGFAQIPSAYSAPTRLLFAVRPSVSSTQALPVVYVVNNTYLAANITTSFGLETFIGPRITFDTWLSFGITIVNGSKRYVMLYLSTIDTRPAVTKTFTPVGNMVTSSSAVIMVPPLTLTTAPPIPAYVSTMRIFNGNLALSDYETGAWHYAPTSYFWQIGTQLGVLAFEQDDYNGNISCGGGGVFIDVGMAIWGRPRGVWPNVFDNPACSLDSTWSVAQHCLGQTWCYIPQIGTDFVRDPCPGTLKWLWLSMTCVVPTPGPTISPGPTPAPAPVTAAPLPFSTSTTSDGKPTSNANAWQISLTIGLRTTGITDSTLHTLMTSFVADMSEALQVPQSRFALVDLEQPTATTTIVSFVVLPNATDPDATKVTALFAQQMQVAGSDLRAGTLLVWASTPPVPLQIVGVYATSCGADAYVISPTTCPPSSTTPVSVAESAMFSRSLLIAVAALVVVVAVCVLCCCACYWWARAGRYGDVASQVPVSLDARFVGVAVGVSPAPYRISASDVQPQSVRRSLEEEAVPGRRPPRPPERSPRTTRKKFTNAELMAQSSDSDFTMDSSAVHYL